MPFRPFLYFCYQYILPLVFLDGAAGYHYARLKSRYFYWIELKRRALHRATSPAAEQDGGIHARGGRPQE